MNNQLKPILLDEPSDKDINFYAIDPLDSRYFSPRAAKYLSEQSRIKFQARVEASLALTLSEFHICSDEVAAEIAQASADVEVSEVYAEEQTTGHDIKALVNCIKQKIGPLAQPYVHFGATSYDIISTATALQLRMAINELVIPDLAELQQTLLKLADKYADTPQIGRTHGQHAVPVTFGFAIAEYVSRLGENIIALKELAASLTGKFSGAVGAYNALSIFVKDPIKFEESVLAKLEIMPAQYSTQIVPPEATIRLIDELVISAGIMANLAHDMRHLQRTEIAEVREHFSSGQTGSSTMAHKRNPKNFENVISISKQVTAQIINANLNISSEHQRDLTDSASSRFYGVTLAAVDSIAVRLNDAMKKLEVDEENMKRNLYSSGGAIAAEPLYLILEKYGHVSAHEIAKKLSQQALTEKVSLYEIVIKEASLKPYLEKFSSDEVNLLKNPEVYYTGLAGKKTKQIFDFWTLNTGKLK